jgi:hypothetical protein
MSFSSIVNGSAVFAGGPFYCAQGTLLYAEEKCMSTTLGPPSIPELVTLTNDDALLGYIDSPTNLSDDRIYLFSGKDDTVVDQAVVKALQNYYSVYVKYPSQIVADYNIEAEHCLPTLDYGEACSALSSPYIGKCQFDGAGRALRTIYPSIEEAGTAVAANLIEFDQTPYIQLPQVASLGDVGYIYVPTSCKNGATCDLHVSFHGCEQNIELIGNAYAANTGFNRWAEANNIIVLYPYAKVSPTVPYNPNG